MVRPLISVALFFLLGGCLGIVVSVQYTAILPYYTKAKDQHDLRYFRTTQIIGTVVSQTGSTIVLQPFQYTANTPLPPVQFTITDNTELTVITEMTAGPDFVYSTRSTLDTLSLKPGDTVRAYIDREATDTLKASIVRKIEVEKI